MCLHTKVIHIGYWYMQIKRTTDILIIVFSDDKQMGHVDGWVAGERGGNDIKCNFLNFTIRQQR